MTIRKRFTAGGMAAAIALTGVTAVGAGWAMASESDDTTTTDTGPDAPQDARTGMVQRMQQALAGLVDDGTITQDQATTVAETLAGSAPMHDGAHGPGHRAMMGGQLGDMMRSGPGMMGGHDGMMGGHGGMAGAGAGGLDVAAVALGLSQDELRAALADGDSLADVAGQQDVAVEDLVDALVAAAQEHMQEAVDQGRLTQEQADEMIDVMKDRMDEHVQQG